MRTSKACAACGEIFSVRPNNQHRKYCSERCRSRAGYLVHAEAIKERVRIWKKENRDYSREYDRVYRESHPEAVHAYHRKYLEANRDAHRERKRKWQKDNPEKSRELTQRHRARKRDAFVEPVDRETIYKRDNYTCQLCRKKVNMNKRGPHPLSPSLDHILPLSKGGTHEPKNVQLVHLICNTHKNNFGTDQLRLFGE